MFVSRLNQNNVVPEMLAIRTVNDNYGPIVLTLNIANNNL